MIAVNSFKSNILTQDIFMADQHKEVLARTGFVVENCGIFLLYGESGSGKSTIVRTFISKLDPSRYCICSMQGLILYIFGISSAMWT